jgi:hypothetical protein
MTDGKVLDESDPNEPTAELDVRAVALVRRVGASLQDGDLSATDRQRQAILGRVLAVGDDESATNALERIAEEKNGSS